MPLFRMVWMQIFLMLTDFSTDDFLGGKLKVKQPKQGYRAGIDPVLLAASVNAHMGDSILDLGCGVGVASLCLSYRISGLNIYGVEIQSDYAALAIENGKLNSIDLNVINSDFAKLPARLRQMQFDHVIANPPYFDALASTSSFNKGRDISKIIKTPLVDWVSIMAQRLKQKGWAHLIYRVEQFDTLFPLLTSRFGSFVLTPIVPRAEREADLMIIHMRKSGRAAFRLESPLCLHKGLKHIEDAGHYTEKVEDILRGRGELTSWHKNKQSSKNDKV